MHQINRIVIPVERELHTLCWGVDELIDGARGIRYRLDGTFMDARVFFGYRFDRAVASSNGDYVAIYEQLGTKGLILKHGNLLREINRSYYCADAYEYPVVFFKLPDGTDVIAHCPDDYNVIEIEEVESGKRLTSRTGPYMDFFHSRLQVSRDGKHLLSTGWIWHPFDTIEVFDINAALADSTTLDQEWKRDLSAAGVDEIHSATFSDPDLIIFAGDTRDKNPRLGVFSISENKVLTSAPLDSPAGTLMALGDIAVSFYEHPKILDVATGTVLHRWSDLRSGVQNSSIIHHLDKVPHLALDPLNRRFAVANSESITVIQIG
jgi:hypothetical protein